MVKLLGLDGAAWWWRCGVVLLFLLGSARVGHQGPSVGRTTFFPVDSMSNTGGFSQGNNPSIPITEGTRCRMDEGGPAGRGKTRSNLETLIHSLIHSLRSDVQPGCTSNLLKC